MKTKIIFPALFSFVLLLISYSISFAQESSNAEAEAQKAWMEYMTPGEMHEMLATHAGKWKTVTKYWMNPDADPEVTNGKAESKMILGGRYLYSSHNGTAMGMPMEGINIEGFDKAKNQFTSVWIDNMGTGFAFSFGTYDPNTKTITYQGTMTDPVTKKDITYKEIMKYADKDHHSMEMLMVTDGKEFKTMEIEFMREMD